MAKTSHAPLHVLVLGDQLSDQAGPLAKADPASTQVLMIESLELAHSMPHHKQKLIAVFSAMRHVAAELKTRGFQVVYKTAESFEAGVRDYLQQYPGATLTLMQPNDDGYAELLKRAAEKHGGGLELVPNDLWLTDKAFFDAWVEGRKELRMEFFYRAARRRTGWLMDGEEPEGGKWNFDHENREVPEAEHTFPTPLTFEPDAITREVIDDVEENFPNHFGDAEPFRWPVTRAQALDALDDFCRHRLRDFGAFEDAMRTGEYALNHSLLSLPLNLGLLHPREVCERALEHYHDKRRKIPLNSIEGFIRQILGWREFMRHVYRHKMPEFRYQNQLEHHRDLPDLYWSGETDMHCLRACLTQLKQTGHVHHIQRLMVLGNFALLVGVNPQALTDWFTATFVDALDWVMVPNVIGMSQYADGGSFTSKPYAASANYIHKMSDYCESCRFDPKQRTGENACPFDSLYWHFIDRHAQAFSSNPRMNMILANWRKQNPDAKRALLEHAEGVLNDLSSHGGS